MASASSEIAASYPRYRFDSASLEARTDEELLETFLNNHSEEAEEAFKALVGRHGPMVLGVCRQILGTDHDAEDSFQAVFFVLARKADTIRERRLLASWLYEVAYRIAVKARADGARRRTRERQVVAMSAESFDPREEFDRNDAWNELRAVLQTEVDRLPEKYRTPVILCYLEGKSNTEAAKILDWPVGSVKGRLSRARDILHSRLMRRNLVLSATFLLSALHRETVFAEVVPSSLLDSTVKSGMSVAGKTPSSSVQISSGAVTLMEAYLRPKRKWKIATLLSAAVLLAGLVGASRASGFSGAFPDLRGRLNTLVLNFSQGFETNSPSPMSPISPPAGTKSSCSSSAH